MLVDHNIILTPSNFMAQLIETVRVMLNLGCGTRTGRRESAVQMENWKRALRKLGCHVEVRVDLEGLEAIKVRVMRDEITDEELLQIFSLIAEGPEQGDPQELTVHHRAFECHVEHKPTFG